MNLYQKLKTITERQKVVILPGLSMTVGEIGIDADGMIYFSPRASGRISKGMTLDEALRPWLREETWGTSRIS